jgi:uncharacterized glyoxalase superfamily protein PhnB
LPDACDWLCEVLGFTEYYRYGEPVSGIQLYLGDAHIMISGAGENLESPAVLGKRTQMLTIIVADVEAHYQRTRQAGTKIWEELHETIYGERQYGVEDIEGHRWLFSQHARDVDPRDWGATVLSEPK